MYKRTVAKYIGWMDRIRRNRWTDWYNLNRKITNVDVDGVYKRRPKPLCPHL